MEKFIVNYYGYEMTYYLQPGKWLSDSALSSLREELVRVNAKAGKDFDYGLFDSTRTPEDHKNFLKTANLCIIRDGGEAIGFFYNLIIQEKPKPVLHAGLVVIAKNRGHDLMGYAYSWLTVLQYKKYGSYYYTNISSTPSIVGVFSDSFSQVWPNYKGNQLKPPSREYVNILSLLEHNYINKYFQRCTVNKKRFVLTSPSSEMGFETNMQKLSRYIKPEVNYFCMFWLDYTKGEDLIQVGQVDLKAVMKINLYYSFRKLVSLTKSFENRKPGISIDLDEISQKAA
ncbi:MAG: hypothetical protein ABI041_06115 [Bdellovibrionia bacterium]